MLLRRRGCPTIAITVITPAVTVYFADDGTAEIFNGLDTRRTRATCPITLWPIALRNLEALDRAIDLRELTDPSGNRLEMLHGDRHGQFSVRITKQYRLCFDWEKDNAYQVVITDYHE
jgi:proteic killer suppression protein